MSLEALEYGTAVFPIMGIDSDSGRSSSTILCSLTATPARSRSRVPAPGTKNDDANVEQKDRARVRELAGYLCYD
jgi:hypothetical protein